MTIRTYIFCLFAIFFAAGTAYAADTTSLGVEGFYDRYREPAPSVEEQAGYGSVTGNYTHDWGSTFGALDGRVSYGRDQYSSPDGSDSGIPQWELDGRVRGGVTLAFASGTLSPYVGLGVRYFVDEGKDTVTSLGYVGYDRRITQFYAPVGATYTYLTESGWTIAPNLELDPLLYGNVNTRFQNFGYYNINNTQNTGFGVRGEFMVGQQAQGYSWQFGPFVRYWDIADSNVTTTPDGQGWIEPKNNRLQVGLALRALW